MRRPHAIVSIHDVTPATWTQCKRWLGALDRRGIPCTILVVPRPYGQRPATHDRAMTASLHAAHAGGHEVALHGYDHRAVPWAGGLRAAAERLIARQSGEFFTINYREAAARLKRGLAELSALGFQPLGFVPPGWLIGSEARLAVRQCGFRYLCTHTHIEDLSRGRKFRAPALCQRPTSLLAPVSAALLPRAATAAALTRHPARLALHPADLSSGSLARSCERAIDELIDRGAVFSTYARFLRIGDDT